VDCANSLLFAFDPANAEIRIDFQEASMKLHFAAVGFLAAMVGCQSLAASPYIMAFDQKYRLDNYIEVNKVTSNGPGWVVIYSSNANGEPGEAIGSAPVPSGTTWAVKVWVEAGRATKVLFARLQADRGATTNAEQAGPGDPVTVNGAEVVSKFIWDKETHGPDRHRDGVPFWPIP
jgi:hypothetical protein